MFLLASIMILNWTVQICSNLCSAWASTWTIRTPGIWPQTTLSAGDQSRSHWYNYRDNTTTTWPPPLIICTVCWPPFTQMHVCIMISLHTLSFAAVGLLCWPASLLGLGQLLKHLLIGDMILGDIIFAVLVYTRFCVTDLSTAWDDIVTRGMLSLIWQMLVPLIFHRDVKPNTTFKFMSIQIQQFTM